MTRIAIDWDTDGAFAVLTRPGAPAEIVRIPDIHRVATEAMVAEMALRGWVVVMAARWPDHSPGVGKIIHEGGPEPHIGSWGE